MANNKLPRVRLLHMKDEIDALRLHVSGRSWEHFLSDYLLVRATERAILIISEAARALPNEMTDRHSGINWAAIRAIGNIIRHEYDRVEPVILWNIVDKELPELLVVVDVLLAQLPD